MAILTPGRKVAKLYFRSSAQSLWAMPFFLSPRPPLLTTVRLSSGEGEIKGVSPSPKVSFFHFGRGGRGRGYFPLRPGGLATLR